MMPMKSLLIHLRLVLISAVCLSTSTVLAADRISREEAIRIATRFIQQHRQHVRSLEVHAWPRWGDFAEEADPAIRKRLSQRKYWFVYFTPRDPNIYGGAHRIYVAADTGQILGWNIER